MRVIYLFRTLNDVGINLILLRFRFEVRKLIDKKLPLKFRLRIVGYRGNIPKWKKILHSLDSINYQLGPVSFVSEQDEFLFDFLNNSKKLSIPIEWCQPDMSRLWNFNLHYFDWARKLVDQSISNNFWSDEITLLDKIIDDWIDQNKPGFGDGWHSYTLSLRIRNWIYLFRIFPELVSEKKLTSLWIQICWLNSHKEICYGGNHLLENLITLIIGSLQFEGEYASKIYLKTTSMLKDELYYQILPDGGHFERTAAYHFLVLDRLIELAFMIEGTLKEKPEWLLLKIKTMTNWASQVILKSNNLPLFNDSPLFLSACPSKIISFGYSLINKYRYPCRDFSSKLVSLAPKSNLIKTKKNLIPSFLNLENTGWTFIREKSIEIIFKFGIPCPKELPAHAHSDLLSFDVFKDGKPLIVSCGTSVYQNSKERNYERSTSSHNSFQLGTFHPKEPKNISWIEPVETWNSFRAARKASPIKNDSGKDYQGNLWARGSHDGFAKCGAKYERTILIEKNKDKKIKLILIEKIESKKKLAWRQFWHLAPQESQSLLDPLIYEMKKNYDISLKWYDSWYSYGFGNRKPRKSLCISGVFTPGKKILRVELPIYYI